MAIPVQSNQTNGSSLLKELRVCLFGHKMDGKL